MICALVLSLAFNTSTPFPEFGAFAPYLPAAAELRESYRRSDGMRAAFAGKALKLELIPHWYDHNNRLWYVVGLPDRETSYVSVDIASGTKGPAFDQAKLAGALSKRLNGNYSPNKLPISRLEFLDPTKIRFVVNQNYYTVDLATYEVQIGESAASRERNRPAPWVQNLHPPDTRPVPSPDGSWTARVSGNTIQIKPTTGDQFQVASLPEGSDYFYKVEWQPNSKKLIAYQVTPGDRKNVFLIQSTPPGGGRAVLKQRVYDLPGDKTDTFSLWVCDPIAKSASKVHADPVNYGDIDPRWTKSGHDFTYEQMDRGFQRWRVVDIDTDTATSKALVEDRSPTFVDSTSTYLHYCDTGELLWRSERDGWGHLYLSDPNGKIENQVTKGKWVVRGVTSVDDKARQIVFQASGMNKDEDPYFIHYFKVNFDGSGLIPLSPGLGTHRVQFAPDNASYVDTYSSTTQPPVHELRRTSDGSLICKLESADISALQAAGWKAPEVFVAKGRDNKTDIWGIVYRPLHMDPRKSYPIVEDIYAGPQDSFTPKDFAPYRYDQTVAELGFIVVQMDGMGTRNRGKAFHDVCWKNLADAGFPDRILWMKALARKYPYMDASRVGVFGTSAGGQNSTAAVLLHPEFYKVAVSSCGCHDNRMDKLWWNEQWMGYPVGPEYAEQSNITNANKLQGQLLLMVGELDTNVPPESTIRLTDALMKAGKEFSFLIIPNSDHTSGGPYGERKRRDFLVKNLLGVPTPDWNNESNPPGQTR